MNDATQVIRDVEYIDARGLTRTTPQVVADTKSFGLELSEQEEIVANQANYHAQAKRYLPYGTDVRHGDRLNVNGVNYEIESVNNEISDNLKAVVECFVFRIT